MKNHVKLIGGGWFCKTCKQSLGPEVKPALDHLAEVHSKPLPATKKRERIIREKPAGCSPLMQIIGAIKHGQR